MNEDLKFFNRLLVILLLMLLLTMNVYNQVDTILAIRAIGIQCNTDYTLEIPDNFKPEGD